MEFCDDRRRRRQRLTAACGIALGIGAAVLGSGALFTTITGDGDAPQRPVTPATVSTETTYYGDCGDAESAGVAPLDVSDPGYRAALDTDSDGLACE